jgi:trimeric autotransporter adhesin
MGIKFNPLLLSGFDMVGSGGGGGGTGTVTNVSLFPVSVGTVADPTTTPIITINKASATSDGYLAEADFITFSNKQGAITTGNVTDGADGILSFTGATGAVIGAGLQITVRQATTSTSGYLSAADWNTFNGKQSSGAFISSLTGDVSAAGPGAAAATVNSVGGQTAANVASATIAALAATSANTASTIVARDSSGNFSAGTITATLIGGASLDLPLTGGTMSGAINLGANKIVNLANGTAAQDAVTFGQLANYVLNSEVGAANGVASLDPSGKVPVSQLPSVVMEYQGAWNPNTNTPALSDGTGTNGNVYYVTAQRSGAVSGLADPSMVNFQLGDLIIYSGSVGRWQLVSPAAGVSSVNGAQGAVTVNAINQLTGDVTAGPASGSTAAAAIIQSIQGTTVSGTTGTGNVVFSSSPTLTGTLNGAAAIFSGSISASNFSGSSTGSNTGDQTITLTGDVTGSGTGSFAATISNSAVTLAKMANLPADTIIGNNTGSSAAPIALTSAQATAILAPFVGDSGSGGVKGLVPAPPSGSAAADEFLKADGTWAIPAGGGGGGSVISVTATSPLASTGGVNPVISIANAPAGDTLVSTGTGWTTSPTSSSNSFAIYTSNVVTTTSTAIVSGSFITLSNSPAFTFTPTLSGTYKVYTAPSLFATAANSQGTFRVVNTSGAATLVSESQTDINFGAGLEVPSYFQSTYSLAAGTTYVFDIQAKGSGGVGADGSNAQFYMYAEGVGLQAGTALSSSFAAFNSNPVTTDSSSVTSGTFTTFSNSPAFTFTPTLTGTYKVYSSFAGYSSGSGGSGSFRVFNTSGSATLLTESQAFQLQSTSANNESVFVQSTYLLTAGTQYVFDLQGMNQTGAGVGTLGANAQFYMYAEGISLIGTSTAVTTKVGSDPTLSGSITVTSGSPIVFPHISYDTTSSYNTATGVYTAPKAGYYNISVLNLNYSVSTDTFIFINGVNSGVLAAAISGTTETQGTSQVFLYVGDQLTLVPDNSGNIAYSAISGLNGISPTAIISYQPTLAGQQVTSGSAIVRSVNSISTATTAGAATLTDYVYLVTGTTTLTLPAASGNSNLYTVKNTGTNTITINTTSSQTIDGSTSITLPVANSSVSLISDGSNWFVV